MKIRSVRPEFFADPTMADLDHAARLLYVGLWCYVDDDGRGEWLPKQIDGLIFPLEDVDIHALLEQLVRSERIVRYSDGDRDYFYIPTFTEYQKPNRKYDSKLPDPADCQPAQGETGETLPTQRVRSAPAHAVGGEGEGVTSPNGDGVFESLFEFVYSKPYEPGTTLPKSERGRLNAGVREAKEAGITADEIRARGRRYATEWRGLTRSPQALLANWTRFAPEPEVPDCENCGNRGVIWFNPAGERVPWDAADATDAAKCGECVA